MAPPLLTFGLLYLRMFAPQMFPDADFIETCPGSEVNIFCQQSQNNGVGEGWGVVARLVFEMSLIEENAFIEA